MAKSVGIDLGTTNSVVAVIEGGRPTVIVNREGQRSTPSVVAYNRSGQRLVGPLAKRQAVLNPESTIASTKRFIGRRRPEVEREIGDVPYTVGSGPSGAVRFEIHGRLVAPEEVSAQVLRKLADDASKVLGEQVTEAVIAVPAYFNDAQRTATRDAGTIAGLKVLCIINEPTAAALAYGLDHGRSETLLVFDLGGGSFDVSILEVGNGVFEVRSTAGDTHLGGDDFDRRIVEWVADEFQRAHGIDLRLDRHVLQRLTEACERAKMDLSNATETTIGLPFVATTADGPRHLEMRLTRATFERLTADLVERCRGPVERAMADARLTAEDLDTVLLVGGSTRMPAVLALVRRLTGNKEPHPSVNPDELVALGAAFQAGLLTGEVEDVVLLDVTPLSLGVETLGGVMARLIERNTTLPARHAEVFSTAGDGQTSVDVHVLQGERELARDNRSLGMFRLEGIREAPRGVPQIQVTFDIDPSGILTVTARDRETGAEQRITLSGATRLSAEEVDRMVSEAERHAEEDRRRRDGIEARNQADSVAYRVEHQLERLGDQVPAHERAEAERLIQEIRTRVEGRSSDGGMLRRLADDLQRWADGVERNRVRAGESRKGIDAEIGPGS